MRIVIQRVTEASVSIDNKQVSGIGKSLLVLVGVETGNYYHRFQNQGIRSCSHTEAVIRHTSTLYTAPESTFDTEHGR